MPEMQITEWDKTEAELRGMVERSRSLTVEDLTDKEKMATVRECRIALKKVRVEIEKCGAKMREEAIAWQKANIQEQKFLVGITEPEELRLEDIEERAKKLAIIEERKRKLPERMTRLLAVSGSAIKESEIIEMDDVQFEAHYNRIVAENNERESRRIAEERRVQQEKADAENKKLKDEQDRILREKELAEAEERGRIKAQKDAEDRAKREREDAERREADEKAKKEREEREAREATELRESEEKKAKARLARQKDFVAWRSKLGYTDENKKMFSLEETATGYALWKKLGEFEKAD